MTSSGDLCANPTCGDLAAPGRDFCAPCWRDELEGSAATFVYHGHLNVVQISQDKEIVFVGAAQAVEAIAALMQIDTRHSAPTSAPLVSGAAGTPKNRIGDDGAEPVNREGADSNLTYLDSRRHSVHVDHLEGGAA